MSFSIFFVPLLVGLCALRVPLCQRVAPLPVRRALDLVQASRTLLALVFVTLASDWTSVALGIHRSEWNATTSLLVGFLALLTAPAAAVTLLGLRRAGGTRVDWTHASSQPDWLADAVALSEREAARLGPRRQDALAALRWLDRQLVARIRRHPLGAAAVLAVAFGSAVAGTQAAAEDLAPAGILVFLLIGAAGMFAFLTIVGAHLHLVHSPRKTHGAGVHAIVAACASAPLTVAFRSSLSWIIGQSGRQFGLAQLVLLVFVVAAATAALACARETLARARRRP